MINFDLLLIKKSGYFYDVWCEYSQLPVDSFTSYEKAASFVNGYLYKDCSNEEAKRGKLFKEFVEHDLKEGTTYRKYFNFDTVDEMAMV
ncbi:hypothetical protein PQ478_08775 [Alkalihalophilus pseudofirmus]|uniref:hypothetical protein n=1 Tax=Alkalihalophilus pseudofirmus TaxID=79885 RepID=UPI00259BC71B|nr:hypothetical protein [Alkalihalophilus pseudofirmus]WEG18563.1 hypothetical protein PQ478_08775 [Alkalihalophilus pseudofirmus]